MLTVKEGRGRAAREARAAEKPRGAGALDGVRSRRASDVPKPRRAEPEVVAGIDLGSNSFHMVVARVVQGQIRVIDRIREGVRLAAGLNERRELTSEARTRALACLRRFGQRVRDLPHDHVRAVGTNTFRQARRIDSFVVQAERALGHPIEVLAGTEEARLVYLGVAHDLPDEVGRRLVVDIGGGSTECIIGERFDPLETASLYMGCVGYSERYFAGGRVTARGMERAQIAARLELRSIERRYRALGWSECHGSSGTVAHVAHLLEENGFGTHGITAKGVRKLIKEMIAAGSVARLDLHGLDASRADVLPGGAAILAATLDALDVKRMTPSLGALREGLLYDLLGRMRHEDVRDQTIRRLSDRYHVDLEQAARVERTAHQLLQEVAFDWDLDPATSQQLLSWAARLHEIGLSVSHTGYHKHGAYLVLHGDMPGFSVEDKRALADLILAHRRKVPRSLTDRPEGQSGAGLLELCALLRVAVCLNRSRSPAPLPRFQVRARPERLDLTFASGWLDQHPLTKADLDVEREHLSAAGLELRVR